MRILRRTLQKAENGQLVELITTDRAVESAAESWCRGGGKSIVGVEHHPKGVRVITIKIAGGQTELGEIARRGRWPG